MVKMVVIFVIFAECREAIDLFPFLRSTHLDNFRFYIPLSVAIILKNMLIDCKL